MTEVTSVRPSSINIYSRGKTKLGRFLSNFYAWTLELPCPDGQVRQFKSIEAYWYWLSVAHHQHETVLRRSHGAQAKALGRRMRTEVQPQKVPDFERWITDALRIKIENTPGAREALAASTLPFNHYYVMGGQVRDVGPRYAWLLAAFETMRTTYREQQGT